MKICVVGFGSIAKRHIRNLSRILESKGENLKVDLLRSSPTRSVIEQEFEDIMDVCTENEAELKESYDAVFITNPTNSHYGTLRRMHDRSDCFFIEKPVFGPADLKRPLDFLSNHKIYYVACPLRYTKVVAYAKERLSDAIFVRAISSSYLPDWRPGTDYRKAYSANKSLGGGVSIDLIHEWDYLIYLFGRPAKVLSNMGKVSSLEMDVEDYASYIGAFRNTGFELHLDYFGRVPRRYFEIYTSEDVILCDILKGSVHSQVSGNTIDLSESRDEYQQQELSHFLSIIKGESANTNTIQHAMEVLKIAGGLS